MAHLVKLAIEDFKRIKIMEIEPDGSTVIIGGRNAQGKSSILDAIYALFWGGKAMPDVPVRKGQKKATIIGVTDDGMTIKRTVTEGGTRSLEITNKDGMSPKSPQAWLDSKLSEFTCDPLAVLRMKPKDQAAELRRIVGVDTTDLDAERAEVYSQRTADGRQLKSLQGALAQMDAPADDCPTEVVSAGLLAGKLEEARELERQRNNAIEQSQHHAREAEDVDRRAAHAIVSADGKAALLKEQIADLKAILAEKEAAITETRKLAAHDAAEYKREKVAQEEAAIRFRTEAEAITIPDTNAIRQQLAEVDTINQQVRAAEKYREREAELATAQATVDAHSERIDQIDAERAELLMKADWPIDGLGIDDGSVTFNGVPLDQASQAEQLRVGVGLALAGNPEIKVALVRDGSHLDEESLALLAATVDEAGAQVWVERVGTHDAGAVVIEDGAVAVKGGLL
jgi:hypothetical protein